MFGMELERYKYDPDGLIEVIRKAGRRNDHELCVKANQAILDLQICRYCEGRGWLPHYNQPPWGNNFRFPTGVGCNECDETGSITKKWHIEFVRQEIDRLTEVADQYRRSFRRPDVSHLLAVRAANLCLSLPKTTYRIDSNRHTFSLYRIALQTAAAIVYHDSEFWYTWFRYKWRQLGPVATRGDEDTIIWRGKPGYGTRVCRNGEISKVSTCPELPKVPDNWSDFHYTRWA